MENMCGDFHHRGVGFGGGEYYKQDYTWQYRNYQSRVMNLVTETVKGTTLAL